MPAENPPLLDAPWFQPSRGSTFWRAGAFMAPTGFLGGGEAPLRDTSPLAFCYNIFFGMYVGHGWGIFVRRVSPCFVFFFPLLLLEVSAVIRGEV